jgi:hypothetical protein
MEAIYFIAVVSALGIGLAWFLLTPRKKTLSTRRLQKQHEKKARTDLLTTPSDYLLARQDQMWHKKRQAQPEDLIPTNRFAPKSVSGGVPEYDGYSRRDRSHVVVGTAYIKKEERVEEPLTKPAEPREGQSGG